MLTKFIPIYAANRLQRRQNTILYTTNNYKSITHQLRYGSLSLIITGKQFFQNSSLF